MKKRNRRRKITLIVTGSVTALVLTFGVYFHGIPFYHYYTASRQLDNGVYTAARAGFESLNNVIITGLLKNQDFRAQFLSRMALHLSTTFDTQRVLSRLNEMVAEVAHDMPYNQDRWGYSMEKWQEYVQLLRDFVQDDQGTRVMEMMQDAQRLFSLGNDEMTAIFGEMWTNGR